MFLTGKLKTLNNSGAPDYSLCNQSTTNLSCTNTFFRLDISNNGGSSYTLVNTTDLSTLSGVVYNTFTFSGKIKE